MSQQISTEAAAWFKTATWKNGLLLEADDATNIEAFYKQYHANKSGWDQAFAFLKDQDLENIEPGKYVIDGENVYASVSQAANMDFDKTSWESHRKYNDIQYVITGKERIGITTAATARVIKDYDDANDISFYTAEGGIYSFQADKFFIFFPQDLHRPGIKVENYDLVKKIVVKIKTA